MMYLNTIGIDLAKNIFHLVVLDQTGKKTLSKKLTREEFLPFLEAKASPDTLISMEACGTAHYWAQEIEKLGFCVKLFKPRDVKAYLGDKQKNDINDALSIAKIALDPDRRSVAIKTRSQQQVCFLHKRRQQLIEQRIKNTNALRSVLAEFGVYITQTPNIFIKRVCAIVENAHFDKPFLDSVYRTLTRMAEDIQSLQHQIQCLDKDITTLNKTSECVKKLKSIPGIGELNASILSVCSVASYATDRDFAASLGIVPKQNTTGGHIKLGRITKRGNRYIRTLLIQGGRSVIIQASKNKTKNTHERLKAWALLKYDELGFNKAAVAVANKLARIVWSVITTDCMYDAR